MAELYSASVQGQVAVGSGTGDRLKAERFEYEEEGDDGKPSRCCAILSRFNLQAAVCIPWKARRHLEDYVNPREVHALGALEELCNATGQECNGILVDYDMFQNVRKADLSDFARIYKADELDFRLKRDAVAVDKGCILHNINDGFTGRAPILAP
jgi:hypothetical protein